MKVPFFATLAFFLYVSVIPVFSQSNTPCTASVITAPAITVNLSCSFQAGTTVGATQQTNAANGGTPSCGSMGPDVWYSFTAPAGGSVEISTQAGSITDGVMALYGGTCGAFTQLACSDDDLGLMPFISIATLTPGAKYLLRFWQYGGGTGTFSICVKDVLTTLPLHLLSFTVRSTGNSHQLAWQTADEINTSHFEVERSTDGISFNVINSVRASGTGNHNYTVTDQHPVTGTNYYRLKSIDLDGKFTYSKIIFLKYEVQDGLVFSVYPNPSGNFLQVFTPATSAGRTGRIIIYNPAGQALLQVLSSGTVTTVDISKLAAGTYIIQWAGDTEILRTRFLKTELL